MRWEFWGWDLKTGPPFFPQLHFLPFYRVRSPDNTPTHGLEQLLLATALNSRTNSRESWFIFTLRKINIDQYCKSSFWMENNHNQSRVTCYKLLMRISLQHNCVIITCTYLNGHLLGAPCEYVLHGLNPGLDWDFCCSLPWAFFLFVLAHPVLAVYSNGSCFMLKPFLANWAA
jgi:hypothetical protein